MKRRYVILPALLLCLVLLVQAVPPVFAEGSTDPEAEVADEALEIETEDGEDAQPQLATAEELAANAIDAPEPSAEADAPAPATNNHPAENAAPAALPTSLRLGVKETYTLDIPGATFKTSKGSVASVNRAGVVKGKRKGSAVVTATVDGEQVLRCSVTVLAAPKKVTLSSTKLWVGVCETARLSAKLPKKTASKIAWSSDRESVATVDGNGVVTAVGEGQAKITAATFNGKRATATVRVYGPGVPTSVSFGFKTLSLGLKESVWVLPEVNAGAEAAFEWSTKNKKIAAVSKDGRITGKKKGTTKITATAQNGLGATLTVKVLKAPSKVTLSAKKGSLAVGEARRLKAKLPKNTASQITWTSSRPGVASVDADGMVYGIAPGQAKITAATFNGKRASCVVTVTEGSTENEALREWLVGEWKVTAVRTDGIDAETCAEFFTLKLNNDGSGVLRSFRPSVNADCLWTVQGDRLLILDGGDAMMSLDVEKSAKRLVLEADGVSLYFTRGVDPAPYYYPKYGTEAEDVNGTWVADRVSLLSEGLTFKAADVGYSATVTFDGDRVKLKFPDGGKTRTLDAQVWYANGQITPLESPEPKIVECFYYYPSLDAVCCTLLPTTQNNVKVYFRRKG